MKTFFKTGFMLFGAFALTAFMSGRDAITIKILSPTKTSSFKTRDTVNILADITSSEALHDVKIKVISLKDSSVIYSKQIHSHSTSMHINEFYINPVVDQVDVKLTISTMGHEGVETAKSELVFACKAHKKK